MRTPSAFLSLLLLATPALAQSPALSWSVDSVRSTKLGETRALYIATPADYNLTKDRYPVLVLLDANDQPQFTAAVANVQFLASRNAIPGLIVVGVPNGKDRTHDMTPPATGPTAKTFPTAGGADVFASFIIDEVLPMVRTKYRALSTTVLAGHSFGGLFAVHVAATRPGAFAGVVAMSPSLWWNDSTDVAPYADAIARAAAHTRLFASSGGLEPPIDITTRRFESRLDSIKPASLAFAASHYPEDTHGLTPQPSLIDGLRYVFEPVSLVKAPVMAIAKPDSMSIVKAFAATESTYAAGARSLGMPERLPEMQVNNYGYTVLQAFKLPNVAAWVFRRNVANYPSSPNVYDSLGDALLAAGDSAEAKVEFRMARDVAVRTGQKPSAETLHKLDQLEHATQAGKGRAQP
jgi:predicted alpha/beta superfamily hydrolase